MNSNYSAQEKNFATALLHNLWKYLLLAASIVATVKIIFFGFDIDEQYAVSMAYRLVQGDRMFLEMWEPHQTSAFFSAAFLGIYVHIFHTLDYAVMFLRTVGVLTQLLISIFCYCTFRRITSENTAFVVSVLYYNIIPKNSTVPDFSNMLLWFSMLVFLCLLHFFLAENNEMPGKYFWLIMSGVSASALVLSYPTCLFVVLPVSIGICCVSNLKNRWRNLMCYLFTCAFCGIGWVSYFLFHMSFSHFVAGVSAMFSDGSHSDTFASKLRDLFSYIYDILPLFLAAALCAFVLWKSLNVISKKRYAYSLILVIVLAVEQIWVWYFMQKRLNYPGLLSYFLLFLAFRYYHLSKPESEDGTTVSYALFWFGSIASLFLLVAGFLASNTQLYESIGYVTIGITVFLYFLDKEQKRNSCLWKIVVFAIIGTAILHKGFYASYLYGHDTIFVSRQKAEDGPMAGIYGRYSDGHEYNLRNQLLHTYIPEGSKLLLVSNKTIMYLQGDYEICNYSTISTPTIDEQLFTYWNLFPDKIPQYIVWDRIAEGYIATDSEGNARLVENAELLVDDEGLLIYRLPANPY